MAVLPKIVGALVGLAILQVSGLADPTIRSGCNPLACTVALSPEDREALGRVAYAEAGNQGEEGLAAVLYAVLNRLASGRFGSTVTAVIESPGQFEPVAHAGGHWRNLPALSNRQQATIETILGLIQQGRLPDPTHGATFFQNPQIVAAREAAGLVRPGLTNFGNQQPVAVVRDHAFFDQLGGGGSPGADDRPQAHLVYPPGVTRPFQVERVNAGPHAVMYRISGASEIAAHPVPEGTR